MVSCSSKTNCLVVHFTSLNPYLFFRAYVNRLPQAKIARDILGPEEVAELLAGGTNNVEKVNFKEAQ